MEKDPTQIGLYTIERRIGQGGMGVVYEAFTPTRTRVALKVLNSTALLDPLSLRRFRQEIVTARRVPTWCTAEILYADVDNDPAYYVSEYIDGPSIEDLVKQPDPIPPADLNRLAVGVAGALAAIHREGVIHRDLTPQNIILGPYGPRVIDLGVALLQ